MQGIISKFKNFVSLSIGLLLFATTYGQKKGKQQPAIDTFSLEKPTITINSNCVFGFTTIKVETDSDDTLLAAKKVNLYKLAENIAADDSITDTLSLVRTFTMPELEKNGYIIHTNANGKFAIETILNREGNIFTSPLSSFISVSYCSIIEFGSVFDKISSDNYKPKRLVNIQIKEFTIFDRIGETVYTHDNNTIQWDGTNLNGIECANGVYYYHCEYIDMANNGEKKSLSGMIELKNNIQ